MRRLWRNDKWGLAAVVVLSLVLLLWLVSNPTSFVAVVVATAVVGSVIASVLKVILMLADRFNW